MRPVAGGRFTLAPVLLDDAVRGIHDRAPGAQNVKTLIAEGSVLGMIGPMNSNVAKADNPLTNDAVSVGCMGGGGIRDPGFLVSAGT